MDENRTLDTSTRRGASHSEEQLKLQELLRVETIVRRGAVVRKNPGPKATLRLSTCKTGTPVPPTSKKKKIHHPQAYGNRIEVLSISEFVTKYPERWHYSKRWIMFRTKGFSCVRCGVTGNKVVVWEGGGLHFDLFADFSPEEVKIKGFKDVMMTIDHHIPRSRGGSDQMSNLFPMCGPCNWRKSDTMEEPCDTRTTKVESVSIAASTSGNLLHIITTCVVGMSREAIARLVLRMIRGSHPSANNSRTPPSIT